MVRIIAFLKKKRSLVLVLAVMVFAGLYSYWLHLPAFRSEYVFMDDAAVTICTYSRYVDPALFQDDLPIRWADHTKFPGFHFVYYIPSLFWKGYDPILLGNIYTILITMVVAFLSFRIGRLLGGDSAGVLCAILMVGHTKISWLTCGGDARTFAWPLILLLILFMIQRSALGTGATIVLQSLLYPLLVLVSVLAYLARILFSYMGRFFLENRRLHCIVFLLASLIAFSIIAYKAFTIDSDIGPLPTYQQMKEMPEFNPGGLEDYLPVMGLLEWSRRFFLPFHYRPVTSMLYFNPLFTILSVGLFLVFLRLRTFAFPISLYLILASGIIWFYVAWWVIFRLFIPMRYFFYPATTLFICFLGVNYARVVGLAQSRLCKAIVLCGILLFTLITGFIRPIKGVGLTDYSARAGIVEFARTLPKDSMIAGDLWDMIPVYALAKRKCLVQAKVFVNHNLNYYFSMKERLQDQYRAFYRGTEKDVIDFCRKYGVDYIFIPKYYYSEKFIQNWSGRGNFVAPFNEHVATLIGDNRDFYLNRPDIEIIFKDEETNTWVYRCPSRDEVGK